MSPEIRQQPAVPPRPTNAPVVADPPVDNGSDSPGTDGDVFNLSHGGLTHGDRPSRRRLLVAGAAAAVLLIGGGVVVAGRSDDSGDGGDPAATTANLPTATVEKRTLEERTELDGTLGYGDVADVNLAAEGTVTALPAIGSIVDRGQTVLEVDSKPIPLLFGDRPLWRQLESGIDDGPDIQQLEANLVALGVVGSDALTVDNTWTSATTAAVKKWQKALGLEQTGVVGTGAVVVLPGAVRIAEHPVPVGGGASGAVLGVTGSTHLITIDLEATRQRLVQAGQPVRIVLPDGTETTGTIATVGNVATVADTEEGQDAADPTIAVTVAFDDPAASGSLDQAPVKVLVVTSAAADVLAVPVEALLAQASGGYAVEVRQADGTTTIVPVELGAFADGFVQITGDVAEGDAVVVPSG